LALREWDQVFRSLPRLDAVFVPGGDPGHTPPKVLFALLEEQAANLKKSHPAAQMWVSPQGFTRAWTDEFLGLLDPGPGWPPGRGRWRRSSAARGRTPSASSATPRAATTT